MDRDPGFSGDGGVEDEPIETAAEYVVDDYEDVDREAAVAVLETVSEDGIVSRDAAQEAVGHVSKVVSTPETRVELAELELSEARDIAGPYTDLELVRMRLDAFEARLEDVENSLDEVRTTLQRVVDDLDSAPLFDLAARLTEVETNANRVQGAADELKMDLEDFQRWLNSSASRFNELDGDLNAVEESLNDLEDDIDAFEQAIGDGAGDGISDRGEDWFELTVRHRVLGLTLEDVRAEIGTLETLAERQGVDPSDRVTVVTDRVADLADRRTRLGDRLEAVGQPEWTEEYASELEAFERDLQDVAPPVDWGTVEGILAAHTAREDAASDRA